MIPTIKQSRFITATYNAYVVLFFLYLALPLVVVSVFAFNDSLFPSLPWEGFTWNWFFNDTEPQLGIFHDRAIMRSIGTSLFVAIWVSVLSVGVGTCNAFLFERRDFPLKNVLYLFMLLPLVIPGIILGISILVFTNGLVNSIEDATNYELEALRPGLLLVVLGQFSFITTIATLVIAARLKKFDNALEEAALNLGATPLEAVRTVTLPFLKPAIGGAAIVAFLMSFENFNTTLMLVGSDAPLTITMFDRLKEGSTPALNAVSLLLMIGSSVLALIMIALQKGDRSG
ncbi:MAG: ABC transporter permease [Hyphomicrobiales bacterium]|nr:MAG: ABC transporter permease [Hyphomicrobiales bacterium]